MTTEGNSYSEKGNRLTRSELSPEEVESIKTYMEKRYHARLPEIEIRYSENVRHALSLLPARLEGISNYEKDHFCRSRDAMLQLKGLRDTELVGLDPSKHLIFLPKKYPNEAGMYAAAWHEVGHAMAHALRIRDKILQESVAIACGFLGLLYKAIQKELTLEQAVDEIESNIRITQGPLGFLFPHGKAMHTIKAYNPELKFRNRDPEELIAELDRSIQHAIETDKEIQRRELSRVEKPIIAAMAVTAIILLIISLVLPLLQRG